MARARFVGQRLWLVATLSSAAAVAGCTHAVALGGLACESNSDCASGWLCIETRCQQVCNDDRNCATPGQACLGGLCTLVESPQCTAASECITPPNCQVLASAECVGARCLYAPQAQGEICNDGNPCTTGDSCDGLGSCVGTSKPCDTPPANECVNNDATYREYLSPGTCNVASGECEYTWLDAACPPGCRILCMRPCEGVACSDFHGGCRSSGMCNPYADPVTCSYQVTSADGTSCVRPTDAPADQHGRCVAGDCLDCIVDGDCAYPPGGGVVGCSTATCAGNQCTYVVTPSAACAAATCVGGQMYVARVCGAAGTCPDAGSTSCNGFACTAGASACRTVCAADGECAAGYYCAGVSGCVAQGGAGVACSPSLSGRDCISAHCQNGYCCASGDCCAAPSDCAFLAAPSVCNDSSHCQGQRVDVSCTAEHACLATTVGDDSGCSGVLAADCGLYADIHCSNAVAQGATPAAACFTNCESVASPGSADATRCDASMACVLATSFLCQAPAGVGSCCNNPGSCAGVPCSGVLVCGANHICCASGQCCTTSADCTGALAALACNTALAQCYASCAANDDAKCKSGYHCNASNQCVLPIADGGSGCNDHSDCTGGHCQNGICCASGSCCVDSTPCGAYACDTGAAHSCYASCASNNNALCSGGNICNASNACSAPIGNGGGGCNDNSDCASGHCQNGVCCASGACCVDSAPCGAYGCDTGTTHSCYGDCATNNSAKCASGNICNASNACQAPIGNGGTGCNDAGDCQSGNCQSAMCCAAGHTCCTTNAPCGVYACDLANVYCYASCVDNTTCGSGSFCVTTVAPVNTCQAGALNSPCDVPLDCDPNLTCTSAKLCKRIYDQACNAGECADGLTCVSASGPQCKKVAGIACGTGTECATYYTGGASWACQTTNLGCGGALCCD